MTAVKSLILVSLLSASLFAHFQVILPNSDTVTQAESKQTIKFAFMHPFEQTYMQMKKPEKAAVYHNGKTEDLKLTEKKIDAFSTWESTYVFKKPGDYIFFVSPEPYFEPAEGKFIKHLTKTVVNAYGMEEGWDKNLGLKAEILPLTRPYGLWKGNTFQGQVLFKSAPVPFAEVEVEYHNKGKKIKAPTDAHITQVVKADKNGVFSYTMPFAGYWGFAALLEDDVTIKKDGKDWPVELGAVLWVETYEAK